MPLPLADALQAIATLAREQGTPAAYLVGGAVRDALLARPVHEVDITVADDPAAFAARAAARLQSHVVVLGGPHPLYRIPLDAAHLDLSAMQGGLESDLARRDFTVNALALPLAGLPAAGLRALRAEAVIDQHGGLGDLRARLLRQIHARSLLDDPIRAFRAARLASELAFRVEATTARTLPATVPLLPTVAPERVGGELSRLFASERAAIGVRILAGAGLLDACFPPLGDGRGVVQRPWHLHDVYEHALVACEWAGALLARHAPADRDQAAAWQALWGGAPWPATRWGAVRDLLEQHAAPIRLAALLHDIGKPATRSIEADGRTRFFGHAPLGAQQAAAALARWRFPGAVVERVALLIGQHLRPGQAAPTAALPAARALVRFHRALGDATPDVCLLYLADALATRGFPALRPHWLAQVATIRHIVTWQPPAPAAAVRRLVDGHAIMRATGLPPGPAVGRLLAILEEAVLAGELRSAEEALALAARLARGAPGSTGTRADA